MVLNWRGVLPNKDEEADNDGMSITWKTAAFELDPLSADTAPPW